MSPAVPGSSPLIPARPFHPCLASRVSLEFGLRLCSAVSLLLLGRAVPTLKAWPSSTAGAGSFSITPGLTQHPRHCPTEHPRLPPEGLATKQGSTSTSVEIPPWQHLSCSSVLQWALTTRRPQLSVYVSPTFLGLSLWFFSPHSVASPAVRGLSALTPAPPGDPDKAQQQLGVRNRNFIKIYGLSNPSGAQWAGLGSAPLLLQRVRDAGQAVTAQNGIRDGQTDTAGLEGGEGGLGPFGT